MHNLNLLNELAFSYQKEDKLEEMNDSINDYFECITECDDTTQSCKRICKELLVQYHTNQKTVYCLLTFELRGFIV